MRLPEGALPSDVTADWVRERDADLRRIRQVSTMFQKALADERLAATPVESQNKFQPGDLVLFQLEKSQPLPSKLTSHYNGPYEVLQQKSNEVQVRHLSSGMGFFLKKVIFKVYYKNRHRVCQKQGKA